MLNKGVQTLDIGKEPIYDLVDMPSFRCRLWAIICDFSEFFSNITSAGMFGFAGEYPQLFFG